MSQERCLDELLVLKDVRGYDESSAWVEPVKQMWAVLAEVCGVGICCFIVEFFLAVHRP